nr:hypothetical protein [Tanacetum cinerariifolium]
MLPEMLEDPYVEVALQAPPSPDYIPGPEEPEHAPPSPDYIPGPEHADDEIEESSEDDEDDDMDIEADEEEEEEEHPAPADSVVIAPTAANQAPSAKETEPFETDEFAATPPPHPAYRRTARTSIPAPVPMPAWTDSEVVRLLAISSPTSITIIPLVFTTPSDSFSTTTPILSPPSPVLSPAPPPSPIRSLGYRAAMIRLRDEAASTSSPPLQLPSASRREDRLEVTLPPRKRLNIALGPRYEIGESSSAAAARPAGGLRADYGFVATMDREIMRDPEREVGYRITDSWDEIVKTLQGALVSTDTELGGYVREFEMRVRHDTDEIYMRLDNEQTERQLLAGRLNMLFRDRRAHAYTRHLMETEARMSREAWVRATDASDLVHGDVMLLRTTVLGQMSEIRDLQAADRRRQTVILELMRIDHRRSTEISELRTALQGQVTALQGQVTALQVHVTTLQGQQGLAGGVRRTERATRECTYIDFLKCQPLPFKGTKGVASLSENQVKMFSEESDKIEKYVGGLPDMIHGSVVASKPKTMQEAIEIATELMDKKILTFAEHEIASKRKFENTSRNTQNQQQQHSNKRQNTG